MINVLITGHRGYLGSVLTEVLDKTGLVKVIGYDNCLYSENASIGAKTEDFRNIDFSKTGPVDVVIHLAGISTNYDPPEKIYADIAMEINHAATVTFAQKAKQAGVKKFIFASSASVYGESSEGVVDENSVPNPLTSYAISKLAAEKELLAMQGDGFVPVILRMVTLFGLSDRMRFDVLVNNLILSSLINKKIVLQSDGHATRPQIHVRDASKIYKAIVLGECGNTNGEVINVGRSDYNISVLDFANSLASVLHCGVEVGAAKTVDKRSYTVDFSKQNKLFPDISFDNNLDTACEEIATLYNSKNDGSKWYDNAVYYNLAQMKAIIDNNGVTKELRFL